jgi:putative molybdopterin biosynthesis protein
MSLYLHDIPLCEAIKILEEALINANLWKVLDTECIPLDEKALGRVLAIPLKAKISSPGYNSAAMDGFMVESEKTIGATLSSPKTLNVGTQAIYVDTGDLIPDGFNAVVPIEDVESLEASGQNSQDPRYPKIIRLRSASVPWKNIRSLGEDIALTQLIFVEGHLIRPVDLGVIAAAGFTEIEVARKPRVAILPTGSELVPIGTNLRPGDILEFNSLILAGKINEWGGEATRFPIITDNFEAIFEKVKTAASEFDLILLNAGSSAGSEDYSASVVEGAGKLLVHGVAVRPGHPVIIGLVDAGERLVPIIGVPGYPVSAALTLDIFVKKLIIKWLGRPHPIENKITAKLTRKVTSPSGDDDYVRVVLSKVGNEILAAPLSRGAGVISSLSQADGLLVIPSGVQGLEDGKKVEITLLRKKEEIESTILCIGSHDLILDKITEFITKKGRRFLSVNVGSIGGLISLNRGESHIAGSHLLDVETGDYDFFYINKYVTNISVRVIALAMREQGLIVKKGNPQNIESLEDLVRPEVKFINRQKGAGTRVLLDYRLNANNILSSQIKGYEQEEYTHLGVAAAVASGRVDCGLGIAAASMAYGLDFIPLFKERYDLIIDQRYADSELIKPLYEILEDPAFKNSIIELKGYDIEIMGKIMMEN